MKKVQFTVTVLLVLITLLSFVSCGDDPFFHSVTLKTADSGESVEVIQDGDEITLQPAKRKAGKINVWILEGEDKEYRIWDKVKVTGNMTFTCKYVDGYVFEFSANGGSGSARTEYLKTGESITLPDGKSFARDGYTVAGWNTKADGSGDTYKPGDKITPSSDLELYIMWSSGSDGNDGGEGGGTSGGGEGGGTTPTESSDYASFLKAYGAASFILDDFAGGVLNAKEQADVEGASGGSNYINSVTWNSSELSKLTGLFTNKAKTERLNIKSYSEASGEVRYGINEVEAKTVTFKIVYQKQTSSDSGANWNDTGDEKVGYVVMTAKRTRTAVTGAADGTWSYSVTGITLSVIPDANGEFMNVDGKNTVSYSDIKYTMTGTDASTITDVKIAGTSLSSDALSKTKTTLACVHTYTQNYTAPKCETAGSNVLTCSKCNYTQTTEIPALGHDYVLGTYNNVTNSISCKAEGRIILLCSHEGCSSRSELRFSSADPNAHITESGAYYIGFTYSDYTKPKENSKGSIKVTHSSCGTTAKVVETTYDSALVGTWKLGSMEIIINADGSCTFNNVRTISYTLKSWSSVPGAKSDVGEYSILYLITASTNEGIAIPYYYSTDKKQISTILGVFTKQ